MIDAFNRRQTLLAALNFLLGGIGAILAFVFFRIAAGMILRGFEVSRFSEAPVWIALACVVLVVILGILEHRRGGGHSDYHETDLFPLETVNANPSRHPLRAYGAQTEEIGYLIRMEKVQFSPRKGTVRRH